MNLDTVSILKQFKPIERLYAGILNGTADGSDPTVHKYYMLSKSVIVRITGWSSIYAQQADAILKQDDVYDHEGRPNLPSRVRPLFGVVQALKQDVRMGHLQTLRELIHGDLFSDFLDAAEHLLKERYKDPSAVMIGGVLEEHLRQVCIKHAIPTEAPDAKGVMKPKKAETLNSELRAANVYPLLDQKGVTAWLDLRNNAAHGHYALYGDKDVDLMLQGVRNFLSKYPA